MKTINPNPNFILHGGDAYHKGHYGLDKNDHKMAIYNAT